MDQQSILLLVLTIFVAVSAIALCIQAGFLFAMYKATKAMQDKVLPLVPKAHSLLETALSTAEVGKKEVIEITHKANEILTISKQQLVKVDTLMTDASSRAKVQLDRVELVLDDTMTRAHETVATVHNGIMRPLREINGLAVGIRTAINHMARTGRASVAQATSDEEMFI